MPTGSISTLGVGSGLDLQDILDQLREVEQARITAKETQKETLQTQIDAYNSVNTKLYAVKSDALSLSLESDFLKTQASVTDEEVMTATADDGIAAASWSMEVVQKARYSSWQTAGVESADTVIYDPPDTGISSLTQSVTNAPGTMTVKYGALEDQTDIDISLTAGMDLTNIIDAVNNSENNRDEDGNQLVTASLGQNGDEYYIRISDASGGNSAESQVSVEGFDFVATDSTISIATAGVEDPMYLSVAPGTTYEELAEAINAASDNPGVTAAIVDTGAGTAPYRLTLTADRTGEENRITLKNMDLMDEVTGEDSLNAVFKVNGVEYQRQTNDAITDVISGVTLNLKKAGETTVAVQTDTESIKESIMSLVEGVNDLINEIGTGNTDGEDEEDAEDTPLAEAYEAKRIAATIKSLITTYTQSPGQYKSLIDLGLEVNEDGTLELNEETLDQALAQDPDAVKQLFIGDEDAEITGLGDIINQSVTDMVSSSGIVATQIDEAETKMTRLAEEITLDTDRLTKKYDNMTAEFVRLDSYINQLNSQSSLLESMIESHNNTMGNN